MSKEIVYISWKTQTTDPVAGSDHATTVHRYKDLYVLKMFSPP